MSKLYVITGPAGVGKSTVSYELAKRSNKSALIEGDDIYNQVVGGYIHAWKEGNHLQLFLDICFDMIEKYLSHGYDVVFNYIITPDIVKKIKEKFSSYETKFVVLLTDENTLLKRDGQRSIDCQMKERCIILLNEFKNHNYDKKNILDTTNLSVLDVIQTIENDSSYII